MSTVERHLRGEPPLAELIAEPITRAVMRADGLVEADVWRAIARARAALGGAKPSVRNAA